MLATTLHMRINPYGLIEGTDIYGPYGMQFSEHAMIWNFVIYVPLLLLVVLCGCCNKRPGKANSPPDEFEDEDEQVRAEKNRVGDQLNLPDDDENQDSLQVYNLVKQYSKPDPHPEADVAIDQDRPQVDKKEDKKSKKEGKRAVKGASFGVKPGECFSLLGVNGAGKSSIFNCLVGQEAISGGHVKLAGTNINKTFRKPHLLYDLVSYCP